jgi:hypothetical protein
LSEPYGVRQNLVVASGRTLGRQAEPGGVRQNLVA